MLQYYYVRLYRNWVVLRNGYHERPCNAYEIRELERRREFAEKILKQDTILIPYSEV